MKSMYMVGGAVRDKLFGRDPSDIDLVVTGFTEESFLQEFSSCSVKKVGVAFPVFLVNGKYEIALARRENSTGGGYNDFNVAVDSVTIEEDLSRRDFTVNAIAIKVPFRNGNYVVGFDEKDIGDSILVTENPHCLDDICNKVLRINSFEHFGEDPLRVLRGLRLAARHGLQIEPETKAFMLRMVSEGCLRKLTKERIWKEFEKAACAVNFAVFIRLLAEFNCYPELANMRDTPQPPEYHPEGDVLKHTELALVHYTCYERGLYNWDNKQHLLNIFSILCHDMGKPLAYSATGTLHGHENLTEAAEGFLTSIGAPVKVKQTALFCAREHHRVHGLFERRANRIAAWLKDNPEFSDKTVVDALCMTCVSDANARLKPVRYLQMNMLAELVWKTRKVPEHILPEVLFATKTEHKKQLIHRGNIDIVNSVKQRYLDIEELV